MGSLHPGTMQTSVPLVAWLTCLTWLAPSLAVTDPWLGSYPYSFPQLYSRYSGYSGYPSYPGYPGYYHQPSSYHRNFLPPVCSLPEPVLPEESLETEHYLAPQPQPVFSVSDLLLPVIPQDEEKEIVQAVVEPITPLSPPIPLPTQAVVEPIPSPPSPPSALSPSASGSSQFHAQDEFGNHEYGYSNVNSAKHEVSDGQGVRGSYSWHDEAGHHTVHYVADHLGYRVLD